MVAGVARVLQILSAIAGLTAVVSLLLGLAFGASASRALATGFYLVGALIMVVGILSGLRGPVRATPAGEETPASLLGLGLAPRRLRPVSKDERKDSLSTAVLFLILGLALIAFGVLADSDVTLF